jgi:ATP-dependent helicase/DNAse subunit B
MKQYVEPAVAGLSPSAINSYIDCPLQFYFKYCAKMKEPQITQSIIDNREFGNFLHKSIEEFYNPLLNKKIELSDLKTRVEDINSIVDATYAHFTNINKASGYNLLYRDMVKEYMLQIIKNDMEYAPFQILGVERPVAASIDVPQHNIKVRLSGNIDRIDCKGNIIRVLDYKTGNHDVKIDTELKSLFDEKAKRSKEAFQAFMYAWMLKNSELYSSNQEIYTGLVVSRKVLGQGFSMFNDGHNNISFNQIEALFLEKLQDVLSKMFDKNIDFSQTEITDNCEYCSYRQICGR